MAHGKSIELQKFDDEVATRRWFSRHDLPPQQDRDRSLRGKARRKARKEQQRAQR